MENAWLFYLILTLGCLVIQGFFSMMEMAAVSFNKVRLQYYVENNNKRAIWLHRLLKNPTYLFGTTLIGVNLTLQLGSEASRHFYEALNLSPDLAPITQVLLVLIFAELAPMFAGRRFAEHVIMLGMGLIYFFSILLRPVIAFLDLLCQLVYKLSGSKSEGSMYLTREELQKVLEERGEKRIAQGAKGDISDIIGNIFEIKSKIAKDLMEPLELVKSVSSECNVAKLRVLLKESYAAFVPLYHKAENNIVSICYPRDLLRLKGNERVSDYAKAPWFITDNTSILQILKQFQRNNQSVAVVLNASGLTVGMLTLDEIIDEIFGISDQWDSFQDVVPKMQQVMIDRRFPGTMKVKDFNQRFHFDLQHDEDENLEELIERKLGHSPQKGESVQFERIQLFVEEAPLIGEKSITIRTL